MRTQSPYRSFPRQAKLYLLGAFFQGLGVSVVWLLFNLYAYEAGFSHGQIGFLLSLGSLMLVLWVLPLGLATVRSGLRPFFVLSSVLLALSLIALILGHSLFHLLLSRALSGIAWAARGAADAPFMARAVGERDRPYLFSASFALGILTGMLGSWSGGLLVRLLSAHIPPLTAYRLTFLFPLLLTLASIPAFWALREPEREPPPTWPHLLQSLHRPEVLKLGFPSLLVGLGAGLFVPFMNLYFKDRFGLGEGAIGALYAGSQIATAAGTLAVPVLVEHMGKIGAVILGQGLSLPFMFILAFGHALPLVAAAFFLREALMNMAQPMVSNFAMEVVPLSFQGAMTAILQIAWGGGFTLANFLGGHLIEHWGYAPPILLAAGLYALSTGLYARFFWGRAMPIP